MTGLSSHCPDPEVIAAFVAGTLSGAELKMTADHLRTCEDCREVVAEAARVDREESAGLAAAAEPVESVGSVHWPWWLGVAAAALLGVVLLAVWATRWPSGDKAIQPLVDAAPRDGRYLEPRLTGGFRWAPLRSVRRGGDEMLDPGQMKLIGAAGDVLSRTRNDSRPAARHASAVAHLLAGHPKEAAALLEAASTATSDARLWSDLAAARYAEAQSTGDASALAEALAASDAALRIDPALPEALFNRALTLERLGLSEQARAAWEQYLAADGGSPWATEARQHLRQLGPKSTFKTELQQRYDELSRDPAAARSLARRFPQDARVWGETEILGRWAEAFQHGDRANAEKHLRVARAFGAELATHGDAMVQHAVAAIDQADPVTTRPLLAAGHIAFRGGQRSYKAYELAAAEGLFVEAAGDFERGGSPVALLAHYFRANTMFDQGRVGEARLRLEQLMLSAPHDFPAYRAQLGWQLGLVYASTGHWGDAIRALDESIATFEHLGESRYANAVRDILAETFDRIGDHRAAWRHRIVALRELGGSGDPRLRVALDAAAQASAANHHWLVAASLLGLEMDLVRSMGDDVLYAETLLLRAGMNARAGAAAAASADLTHATQVIDRLHDASLRDRTEADRLAIESLLAPSPSDAVPLLTRAIEFHQVKGRRMHLPELYLQRGRAAAALGQWRAAGDDFESGIREMETQRASISADAHEWGTFAIAEELYEEAIGLCARRGDAAAAFAYSERSRARELGIAPPVAAVSNVKDAGDALVIEYAALPKSLVIFAVARTGVRTIEEPIGCDELAANVERLVSNVSPDDEAAFRSAASVLYQRLIEPIALDVGQAGKLVFVAGAPLDVVPFSALLDPSGHYLVEQHSIVASPSRAKFLELTARREALLPSAHLLLVAGPVGRKGDVGSLTAAQREAIDVAAAYGITVEDAERPVDDDTFAAEANGADVVHFIGHADLPDAATDAALVTSSSSGPAGRLDAREIAAFKLTRPRVVVLAACGTGRAHERLDQTNISVARAFLAAGVPTVVATLWPIDDAAAAEFFPLLHRQLARGRAPADALRAAQLEWIHRPGTSPALWAAVQIIGS